MFKKLIISAIILGGLTFPLRNSLAAPTGGSNPIVDGSLVCIAAEFDYVVERDLKSSDIKDGKVKDSGTFYAKATFKVTDFFNVYLKAGTADFRSEVKLNNGADIKEEYKLGFYGGGGARFSYQFVPKVKFTLDNQLNFWRSELDRVRYRQTDSTTESGHISIWEYQAAGILSYAIDFESAIHPAQGEWPKFIPYAGAKYAYLRTDSNASASGPGFSVSLPDEYKNENKVGIVCGLDLWLPSVPNLGFNVEGRFLDETAVSCYLDYNF